MTAPDAQDAPYTIDDFVRVQTAQAPSFSSEGRRIAFRSNRSGVSQAFVVAAEGEDEAPARQLTDTGTVIYGVHWRPGHEQVLYVTDDGGDEQFQLHLLDLTNGDAHALASAPGTINEFGAWSADGRLVSFRSNRRDRRFFDVYVADADSGEARRVHQSDEMNAAGRFGGDGSRLLFWRPNLDLPGDGDLFVADLTGGETRRLTEHEGAANWSAAHFHPWGAVLALSDEGRDFAGLQRIDPATGDRRYLLTPEWDVEAFALSPGGTRAAVIVNEDGYSRPYVFEVEVDGTLGSEIPVPETPPGIISGLDWRPDGGALAFSFVGARHPADAWLMDLESGNLRRLTRSSLGSVPVDALPEPELVRYRTFDEREIPAFFYRPPRQGAGERVPCVVLVHGGPEGQSRPALWAQSPGATYLLARGDIALLVPNVRGSTGYGKEYAHADDVEKRMDSVRDLIAATDWLVATGKIAPERIGVMGGSYGGFMTLAAITEAPERWAAAVDMFGIANFETFLENTGPWRRRHRAREYGDDPAFLKTISPIFKADRIRAPLLVIQGDHDVRVPPEESQQIADTVRRNEGVVEYVVYEREGHGIQHLHNRLAMARTIVRFLEEHLLGE